MPHSALNDLHLAGYLYVALHIVGKVCRAHRRFLLADGWQTMRLSPHQKDDVVSWYSATDKLPVSIDSEYQKYIREVFPCPVAEVQLGHWSTVDAYIDRMIQYQCLFCGKKLPLRPSSAAIIGIFILFFCKFFD